MQSTPVKSDLDSSNLTPVRFILSPVQSKDCKGIRSRLKEIIQVLQENQKKWEAAQKRGLSLCHSIEAIKTKSLISGGELYPKELAPYCEKLKIVFSIFQDVLASAQATLKQIKALANLSTNADEIIFRTWSMRHYVNFIEEVVDTYKYEVESKKLVTEGIAHSKNRIELVQHTSVWEHPAYTEEAFLHKFLLIAIEMHLGRRSIP